MSLLTNAILLAPSSWVDLGAGPMTVSAHGAEWANVVLALADTQPPPTLVEGEPLRGTRMFGSSSTHVWALALGSTARVVVTAPDGGGAGGGTGGPTTIVDGGNVAQGSTTDAAWPGIGSGTLVAVLKALWARLGTVLLVQQQPFQPVRGASVGLSVGPAATGTPVALPTCAATSYRVRNAATSASPVTWIMSTSAANVPTIPGAYSTAGTGGSPGDKTIDPGGVEVIGLSAAQQAALAGGTLVLSAICPTGGSALLTVSPGTGG